MVILREEGRNCASVHDRDDYTEADALAVVEWLNGHDHPLPAVNVANWPWIRNPNSPVMYTLEQLLAYDDLSID